MENKFIIQQCNIVFRNDKRDFCVKERWRIKFKTTELFGFDCYESARKFLNIYLK